MTINQIVAGKCRRKKRETVFRKKKKKGKNVKCIQMDENVDWIFIWRAKEVTILILVIIAGIRAARFFLLHDTKTGKMYQMKTKRTKW
jgi:hypothetical protein